jgi:hypothetical protein
MDRYAFTEGDMLHVQTSIHNRSSINMSSVSLRVFENLEVSVPNRRDGEGLHCVCQSKAPGVRAGERRDQVLSLPLEFVESSTPDILTTLTSKIVKLECLLVISCKFLVATTVEMFLPIVILPLGRSEHTPIAAKVSCDRPRPARHPATMRWFP